MYVLIVCVAYSSKTEQTKGGSNRIKVFKCINVSAWVFLCLSGCVFFRFLAYYW